MAHHDPMTILLTHNAWANRNLLDACAPLTAEQFHHPFEMGPGTLHNTITHILGAMRGWTDLLTAAPQRPRLEETTRTVPELLELHEEVNTAFVSAAQAKPADTIAHSTRNGKDYTYTHGGIITHVTTHGMHHRAQCLNMLRHLGIDLPQSAVVEWMRTADQIHA